MNLTQRVFVLFCSLLLVATAAPAQAPAPGSLTVPGAESYRVDTLRPGLWRIQAVKGTLSTAYLIAGESAALLVDTCTGQPGLDRVAKHLVGDKAVTVALTHGHGDHSGGAGQFPAYLVHPADATMIPATVTSARHDLIDGTRFDLGGTVVEVVGIPGHTPGSVAFLNRAARYIMTGDGIGSSMVWMQLGASLPLPQYLKTLEKLDAYVPLIDTLYVGHAEQERTPLTPAYITDMRVVTQKVIGGTIETKPYEMGNRSGRSATYGSAMLVFDPAKARDE